MAFIFSYDLDDSAHTDDRSRIRIAFERFGWETVGGSSVRYPAFGRKDGPDDYFNQVQPALTYFRIIVAAKGIKVTKYSLVADSEAYYSEADAVGCAIAPAADIKFQPSRTVANKLSEPTLRRHLVKCEKSLE